MQNMGKGQYSVLPPPLQRIQWTGALHAAPKLSLNVGGVFHLINRYCLNPSNGEATFVQSIRTKIFLKNHPNPVMLVFIG